MYGYIAIYIYYLILYFTQLTTSIYSTAISTLCNNGSTDTSCEAVVDAVSNTCSGITFTANPELCPTCETELSAVMAACENTVSLLYNSNIC